MTHIALLLTSMRVPESRNAPVQSRPFVGPQGNQQVRRVKRGKTGVCLTLHDAQPVGEVGGP